MSDEVRVDSLPNVGNPAERLSYEPPTVTLIGNARELLAGAVGSLPENPGPIISCSNNTRSPSNGC
jgi:hypothetical protein